MAQNKTDAHDISRYMPLVVAASICFRCSSKLSLIVHVKVTSVMVGCYYSEMLLRIRISLHILRET